MPHSISTHYGTQPHNAQNGSDIRSARYYHGFGYYVHKDGYNVLYGDYHTEWYGDSEQRIIYWDQADPFTELSWSGFGLQGWQSIGIMFASLCRWGSGQNTYGRWWRQESLPLWHQFDLANDMDIGADYTPYPTGTKD